jgi:hypothetical protein
LADYFARLQEQRGLPRRFEPQVYAQALISTLFSIGVLSRLNLGQQTRENVVMAALALYE